MSDVNKIVAAILTHGFVGNSNGMYTESVWPETYKRMLATLAEPGEPSEPAGPDLNAIKTAVIETLDRVLAKK